MLRIHNLEAGYADVQVLWNVNLELNEGETVALIGPNGAGKTTLLNCISGLLLPKKGNVFLDDKDISLCPAHLRTRLRIIQVPEGRKLFAGMTVQENLLMGAYYRKDKTEILHDLNWVYELFPEIGARKTQLAGTLSGGEQQMCAIGRALMGKPRFLLIDEMSLGVAPVIVDRLIGAIKNIQSTSCMGILIVEQDVLLALELSSKGYVLEMGNIVKEGKSEELLRDKIIRETYLGIKAKRPSLSK